MPTLIPFSSIPNWVKRLSASALDLVGFNQLGFTLQEKFLGPFVRAVNYHVVSPEDAASFEEQLRYYSRHFVGVDRNGLETILQGTWKHAKPGIILSFDDGHWTHYEIVAPLLEKYGFVGWFFVPVGLLSPGSSTSDGDRAQDEQTITLEQLEYLDRHHIVGSHTETHCHLRSDVPKDRLEVEIAGSQEHLEKILDHPVDIFCWVGGQTESYSREAALLIRENYEISFMTNNAVIRAGANRLQLQRTNVEAENPLSLVRFQLSGLMDLYYSRKRRLINELTK